MKILILEDEPIIAIDLAEIVADAVDAEVVNVYTIGQALACLDVREEQQIDFALLDLVVGRSADTAVCIASRLLQLRTPFGFITSAPERLPSEFRIFPTVTKPFPVDDVKRMVRSITACLSEGSASSARIAA